MPVQPTSAGRRRARDPDPIPLASPVLKLPFSTQVMISHVPMRVRVEAGVPALTDIVVGAKRQPEVGYSPIVVVAEAEAVPRVEPVHPGMEPVVRRRMSMTGECSGLIVDCLRSARLREPSCRSATPIRAAGTGQVGRGARDSPDGRIVQP